MAELGQLSAEYESNGDPACVSSGINELAVSLMVHIN